MNETFRVDITHLNDRSIEIGETFLLMENPFRLELVVDSIERVHPSRHSTKTIVTCKLALNLVPQR